jgi:hypothetical protein
MMPLAKIAIAIRDINKKPKKPPSKPPNAPVKNLINIRISYMGIIPSIFFIGGLVVNFSLR